MGKDVVVELEFGKIIRKQKFHAMNLSFILIGSQSSFLAYVLT